MDVIYPKKPDSIHMQNRGQIVENLGSGTV